MSTVRALASAQFFVTVFLAVLLWSLNARLHRQEYNRWWVGAWTLSALFLAVGWVALAFPSGWTALQGAVVLLAVMLGFMVAPMLVFGAMSFRSAGSPTKRTAVIGTGLTLALAVTTFAWSLKWSAQPFLGFAFRNGARTLILGGALIFSAWVFFQRIRVGKSSATLLTSLCFLGYGITQSVHASALLATVFNPAPGGAGRTLLVASIRLLYLDVLLLCGICLGMILLLVEAHQRSERALRESVDRTRVATEENTALQREITTRLEVEKLLRASEDRYRDLVEHSEDLICTHDLDGRILSFNRAAARLLGYEVEDLLRMNLRELLAPEVRHELDEYFRVIQRNLVARGLVKVVTRTGARRIWSYRNSLRVSGVAAPIVRGMARDVTEQVRAERALRKSEEKFAIAFRSSPSAKAIISLENGGFLDVNAAFESLCGYDRDELVRRAPLGAGIWPDPADREVLRSVLTRTGRLTAREMRVRHSSGREYTAVFSAEFVPMGGEEVVLLAGLDTTARKEAEARQRAILKALPDWVFLMDASGVYLEFYGTERGLLAPPAAFIGRHFAEVLPPELAARVGPMLETALHSDEPATMEYSLRIGDEEHDYEVRAVRTERDRVLSLVRDVTDRKRAEYRAGELRDELAHASRAMTLGALNGSLAHEVNQPLAAITTNAYVAQRLLDAHPGGVGQIRELLRDIVSDSQRIDDVLRRMRRLLRKDRREDAVVDINLIVSEVLKLVHSNMVERRISTEVSLASNLPGVRGDRVQLQQVVLNILMNAADALSADGVEDREIRVTTASVDDQVVVSVSDRGAVVSDTAFERMFEPFFTTKPDGMGLGLSICRTILEAHGGEISARRNADRGLTCWFALDGVESQVTAAPHPLFADPVVAETRAT
jgi:PAS domain S-box-containing protein